MVILALKALQSVAANNPLAEAEAEGSWKVCVLPFELIKKSVPEVELAKSCVEVVSPFKETIGGLTEQFVSPGAQDGSNV